MKFSAVSCSVFTLLLAVHGYAQDSLVWRILRESAADAPSLEVSAETGNPRLQPIRMNVTAKEIGGRRYGMIKLKAPAEPGRSLVWMFSDLENIDQYELMALSGGEPIRGNFRTIYPPLTGRPDGDERPVRGVVMLPKPWDLLELHLLGVPAELLKAGEDYLIWFRFADRQPVDILMGAVFLDPAVKLIPEAMPGILGLPDFGVR